MDTESHSSFSESLQDRNYYLVKDYLHELGFLPSQYYIKDYQNSIEVDFDDNQAVFYIIEDIKKTKYIEHFDVDYKKPANSRRHTAVFNFTQ